MAGNPHPQPASALVKFTSRRDWMVSFCLPAFLLFVLWLWPFATGPLLAVWPGLFAWTIGLCLCLCLTRAPQNTAVVVATACLCAALVSSVLGGVQYFGLSEGLWPLLVPTAPGQASANLRQVNHLATLLAVGFWALLWLMPRWSLPKATLYLSGFVLAVGMAATASRTGALELLFVAFLAWFWRKPGDLKTVYVAGFVVLAYLGASVALPGLLKYFAGLDGRVLFDRMWMNDGCHSRAVLWRNVLHLISLKPLTGWGVGELAYAHYITLYDEARYCEKLGHAHNVMLHAAAVMGIPVAVALTALAGYGIYYLKPWRESQQDARLAWGVIGVLLIHSMLEYPLWFGNFQVLGLLCVALVWLTRRAAFARLEPLTVHQIRWISIVVLTMMLALVWRGWDYLRVSQLYLPAKDRLASFEFDTMNKASKAVLFSDEVFFAQVNNATPDALNAKAVLAGALVSIHSYPEPRIVNKLILAALLSGDINLANYHALRFKAVWPVEYSKFFTSLPTAEAQRLVSP